MCQDCKKNFRDPSSLKKHIRRVHLGEKNITCDQCSFSSFDKHKLAVHVNQVHSNSTESCLLCKAEIKSMYHHMKSKHSDQPEAYEYYKKIQSKST